MKTLFAATAILLAASGLQSQDRGAKRDEPPSVKGRVTAYEAEKSITVESTSRNGEKKTEFAVVKDRTRIDLGFGRATLEEGMSVTVTPDKENPKTAARIVVDPKPASLRGKVAAYEAEKSITVEIQGRGSVARHELAIAKGGTLVELGLGVKAIEPGTLVSVWTDGDRKNALKILAEPDAPTLRGKVLSYEAEKSIVLETRIRGGDPGKSEFALVKDKTEILLGEGLKAIEAGMTVSVYADKADPRIAARILAQSPAGR